MKNKKTKKKKQSIELTNTSTSAKSYHLLLVHLKALVKLQNDKGRHTFPSIRRNYLAKGWQILY